MKLRSKPVEIEAVEWNGKEAVAPVPKWFTDGVKDGTIKVRLDELHAGQPAVGEAIVFPGCYLAKRADGSFFRLTNDELLAGWSVIGAKKAAV
jgi:hypothetical protein